MTLQTGQFNKKFARAAVALLLIVAFFTLFTHYHAHGDDQRNCSVCHVVKQIAALSIAAAALLAANAFRRFRFPLNRDFYPLLFAPILRDRSPPFFV